MNPELAKIAKDINKKLGDGSVVLGSEISRDLVKRVETGCLSLDVALNGGWPTNQWNEVIGMESAGKTTLILKAIAHHQRLDPDYSVVWVAAEHFVYDFAEMCGVDVPRMIIVNTKIMEQAYEAVIQYLDSRAVDMVVIDSLPGLVPSGEDEKAMDELTVGLGAKITNQFFRKAGVATNRSLVMEERPVVGLMINQWRSKIGGYGDPRTTPGGMGKNFAYFTRIEVTKDEWIKDARKQTVGQTIKIKVKKNKAGPPDRSANVDFYFQADEGHPCGSYDIAKDYLNVAMTFEIITRPGGYYLFRGGQLGRSREATLEMLQNDIPLRDTVGEDVMAYIEPDKPKAPAKKSALRKRPSG